MRNRSPARVPLPAARTLSIPQPSPRQREFLLAGSRFVAFGGARGGGKSWAVRCKAVLLCLRNPGITCMIVRKTYPELQENHIRPLCELLRCRAEDTALRLASYHDGKKALAFPNGSRILFRYCDTDKDADRFQGTEVDVLFVDEATQQTEERMKKLIACVRGVNAFPKRIYFTCNPGGEGHAWVKRLFIDRQFREGENPADYTFIRSLVTDNKALMASNPDYIRQLEALPEKLRKAWLEGDWNVFEGMFFADFRTAPDWSLCQAAGITREQALEQRRFTHVIPAFDISRGAARGWKLFRSYDFGYARPFSCGWWAMDYDGVLYRILELYGCTATPNEGVKWTPEEQFTRIAELEREHPWLKGRQITGIADPAIWDASRGESIADIAVKHGVFFTPGDHKRVPGWMQLHYRFQFDENGYPGIYIFDTCKAFIRTLPTLQFSRTRPEDLDSDGEDHIADETRYLCMSRPIRPQRTVTAQPAPRNPLSAGSRPERS